MEAYDVAALGVESAWPAFVDGAAAPLPVIPSAQTPVHAKESAEHPVRS